MVGDRAKPEVNRLAALVDMANPDKVMAEVETVVRLIVPEFDFAKVEAVFGDVKRLFRGEYPGYRRCNTEYHNLQHTTDCLLAMTRLMHGATLSGESFSKDNVTLALLAAMFHDAGYMQAENDTEGTGAKYTIVHIGRSIDFMCDYFAEHGFPAEYGRDGADMLNCTGLNVEIAGIAFTSHQTEVLGKMLGTADLLGQMADRTYLEKLLFLFYEFIEGKVQGYGDETELLNKTLTFYQVTRKRFAEELGGMNRFTVPHFRARWKIDADLYSVALDRNQAYLRYVLDNHEETHREFLRRGDIIRRLEEKGL